MLRIYCAAGALLGGVPASGRLSAVSADHPFRLGHFAVEVGYCLLAAALWPLVVWQWIRP